MRRIVRIALTAAGVGIAGVVAWLAAQRPSNDRHWRTDQDRVADATFAGDTVRIRNVRNFHWISADSGEPRWDNRTYDLGQLNSVWYVVVPFINAGAVAHTFVSFGFADLQYVAISVEARKEVGETYDALAGLFRRYELMYVVADERDVLAVRTNHRPDSVFLYRVHTTPERARALFVSMLQMADSLRTHPAFYNSLIRNCTSTIAQHVNSLVPGRVPFSYKILLPGYADRLAYDIGLFGDDLPFPELRRRAFVNDRGRRIGDSPDFAVRIRAN